MRLWIDVVNAPHVRLFARIVGILGEAVEDLLTTTRSYGYLEEMAAEMLSFPGSAPISVGQRAGGRLEKLMAHLDRVRTLAEIVHRWRPTVAAAKASPELSRVAFGLGIPAVIINDNDKSYHVSKLTFPLASAVVVPEAFGRERAIELGADPDAVVTFRGVCEVAHVLDYLEGRRWGDPLGDLGLEPGGYVVVRPEPKMVAYGSWKGESSSLTLIRSIRRGIGDLKLVVFPRDQDEAKAMSAEGAIVPGGAVDALQILANSTAFIGAGGTMTREAALLGVRTVSLYPGEDLAVDRELEEAGLIRRLRDVAALGEKIEEVLESPPPRSEADLYLRRVDDPAKVMANVVREISRPSISRRSS